MPHPKNGDDDDKKKQLSRYDKHGAVKGNPNVNKRVSDRTSKMRKKSMSLAQKNIARMRKKKKGKDVQSVKKDLMKGKL